MPGYIPPEDRDVLTGLRRGDSQERRWRITDTDVPFGHVFKWVFKMGLSMWLMGFVLFLFGIFLFAALMAISGRPVPDPSSFPRFFQK